LGAGVTAAAALAGCVAQSGGLGQPCKSTGILAAEYCDDGLVCARNAPTQKSVCSKCSPTDSNLLCSTAQYCDNGACVACPNGGMECAPGAFGQACLDGGTCLPPLTCGFGGKTPAEGGTPLCM
jgi:hypothetical protein